MMTTTNERPIPTGEGLTFEKVWAMFQETDRKMQETSEQMKETSEQMKETDRKMQETDRRINKLNEQMGGLHNSFGELAEHMVAPGILQRFNELGFEFHKMNPGGQRIFDRNGKILTEIDLLLENGNCIMVIEVKSKPKDKHIEHHIKRIELIREDMDEHNDKRKIYGAVAGAIFGTMEKNMAIEAGLYVLEQSGDTMKLAIPENFIPKEW